MSSTIFYESDFYIIEVDTATNLIQSKWLRNVTDQEVVEGGTKLYEALRDTKVELVVADAKNIGSLSSTAKEWLSVSFYDLLSQTPLKRIARVMPDSVFQQIALESVVTRAEALGITKFDVKNFSNTKDALKWVLKQ
jgi:hypothetical protein